MKIFKSGMKVLGIIALICVLTLSFSPSKAFAQPSMRTLEVTGKALLVDDEIIGEERCNYAIDESIDLTAGQSGTLLNFKECCGDEVRAELLLEASLEDDIFNVSGTAKLFEGTSCNTKDLEDEEGISELVTDQRVVELEINLLNRGGGDTADFDLVLNSR